MRYANYIGRVVLVVALGVGLNAAASLTWGGVAQADESNESDEAGEAQQADQVDYVALASRLVQDGFYERAGKVIQNAPVAQLSQEDKANYYTIRGLIALNQRVYADAVDHFDDAIRFGKTDDVVFVYLAQAYYGLKKWEECARAVTNAGEEGAKVPRLQLMKAQAEWKMGEMQAAWRTLYAGSKRFPDEPDFVRQRIFLLIELGLYREAMQLGQTFMESDDARAEDYLAVGEALRRNGQVDEAIQFLEQARLLYPSDKRVVVQLANAYADADKPLAGADLFQRAAELDPKFVREAAELFRRAGAYERALYMNAQVEDQAEKFRQRVGILVDMGDFEKVANLQARVERLGLIADQNVLYALAYARFQTGDYAATERLLKKITDPDLFRNATQLRQVMAYCEDNPGSC
jgi:tetratricopeptide (TPR) repeat protein